MLRFCLGTEFTSRGPWVGGDIVRPVCDFRGAEAFVIEYQSKEGVYAGAYETLNCS